MDNLIGLLGNVMSQRLSEELTKHWVFQTFILLECTLLYIP